MAPRHSSELIRFSGVGKRFSRLQGAKLLSNWGFWRDELGPNWFMALDGIDFSITTKGKRIALIGANGSGKTTLLKIIAGVTQPTYGTVVVNGRVVPLLELFAGIQTDLTGRENIYLNGIVLGMRRHEIESKFDEIVAFSGVSKFIDMPMKHYSQGMMMRLSFSIASHIDADIMLVDEVWGVGDAEFRKKSLDRLEFLAKKGLLMFLVSHDLEMLRRMADEAFWLQNGKIMLHGPVQKVIDCFLQKPPSGTPAAS